MSKLKCPEGWKPACCCSLTSLEPSDKCWVHGGGDGRFCPYCHRFRYNKPCTSCGCIYGIVPEITPVKATGVLVDRFLDRVDLLKHMVWRAFWF